MENPQNLGREKKKEFLKYTWRTLSLKPEFKERNFKLYLVDHFTHSKDQIILSAYNFTQNADQIKLKHQTSELKL